jgi:hypothetical protein
MSVRPTLLKDIRRTAIEQHKASKGKGSYNSFEPLTPRGRTFSVGKRQLEDSGSDSSQAAKNPKLDSNMVFEQLKVQDAVLTDIDSELAVLAAIPAPENKDPRLDSLCKIVSLLAKSQKNLTSALMDSAKLHESPAPVLASAPAPASGYGKSKVPVPVQPPASAEETARKKVQQALRDAEKKTVLFNLDLGKNPIMNKDSLSRKVTESLAASVKFGLHDYHNGDAETVLDDVLSCSKLEFLGNSSKLYYNNRNANDPKNNKMYTVPVRFDFKDRDTRFNAEIMLRKVCKVNCAVPYPRKMRSLLGELVRKGKALQPDCFIRTKVNVEKLQVEAHAKTASGWLDLGLKCGIPLNILDATLDVEPMQTTTVEGSQIS